MACPIPRVSTVTLTLSTAVRLICKRYLCTSDSGAGKVDGAAPKVCAIRNVNYSNTYVHCDYLVVVVKLVGRRRGFKLGS